MNQPLQNFQSIDAAAVAQAVCNQALALHRPIESEKQLSAILFLLAAEFQREYRWYGPVYEHKFRYSVINEPDLPQIDYLWNTPQLMPRHHTTVPTLAPTMQDLIDRYVPQLVRVPVQRLLRATAQSASRVGSIGQPLQMWINKNK